MYMKSKYFCTFEQLKIHVNGSCLCFVSCKSLSLWRFIFLIVLLVLPIVYFAKLVFPNHWEPNKQFFVGCLLFFFFWEEIPRTSRMTYNWLLTRKTSCSLELFTHTWNLIVTLTQVFLRPVVDWLELVVVKWFIHIW